MRADFDPDTELRRPAGPGSSTARSRPTPIRICPYERLVEELAPAPRGQPQPGLPGHVRLPERRRGPAAAAGIRAHRSSWSRQRDVQVRPDAGRVRPGRRPLRIEFEYSSDLFEPATVARLAANSNACSPAWSATLPAPSASWSCSSPTRLERERQLEPGRAVRGRERPVHEAVADWAHRPRRRRAVRWDGGELTYAGLAARADLLAGRAAAPWRRAGDRWLRPACRAEPTWSPPSWPSCDRGGVPAARPRQPCRPAGLRVRRRRRAAGGDQRDVGGPGARRAAVLELDASIPRLAGPYPGDAASPATWPTSSTRRVRPAAPRG